MNDGFSHNGAHIHLRESGEGQPVIAVHCSSSHSGQWKPLIGVLGGRFKIMAPDLHGYGQSDPLPRDGNPWFQHDGGMVHALMCEVGEPVHLVGHSLGGATAFFAASVAPDKVASLTLIEPVLFALLDEAGLPEASDAWWIASVVHGQLRLGNKTAAAKSFVDFWSAPGTWDVTPPKVQEYILQTINRVGDDWAGIVAGLSGQVTRAGASQLNVPTQLIRGGKTRASARLIVDILDDAMPNSTIVDIDSADHMAAVTHPELIIPHIVRMLEENSKGRG